MLIGSLANGSASNGIVVFPNLGYKKDAFLEPSLVSVMDMVIFRTIFFELLVFFTFTLLTLHFAY